MRRRERLDVAALLVAGASVVVLLIVFASRSCPTPLPDEPCDAAIVNRVVVVGLVAGAMVLVVTPFAFLGEYGARRRIVYRGAWSRALRRGAVAGAIVAVAAGLRLGGVLTAPLAIAIVALPVALEVYVTRTELRGGTA